MKCKIKTAFNWFYGNPSFNSLFKKKKKKPKAISWWLLGPFGGYRLKKNYSKSLTIKSIVDSRKWVSVGEWIRHRWNSKFLAWTFEPWAPVLKITEQRNIKWNDNRKQLICICGSVLFLHFIKLNIIVAQLLIVWKRHGHDKFLFPKRLILMVLFYHQFFFLATKLKEIVPVLVHNGVNFNLPKQSTEE